MDAATEAARAEAREMLGRIDRQTAALIDWLASEFATAGVGSEDVDATPGTVLGFLAARLGRPDLDGDHPIWGMVRDELGAREEA